MSGGTVHLGGGWQGGGDLPHARQVLINAGSEVKADGVGGSASTNGGGGGGEMVVWSTQSSQLYGTLQAREGGRIELSSQGSISTQGDIQVGTGGSVLFDPKNIIIENVNQSGAGSAGLPNILFDEFGSSHTRIAATDINQVLGLGSAVILQAKNDITVNANIIGIPVEGVSRGGDLTLQAGRSIVFNQNIFPSDSTNLNIITGNGNLTAVAGDVGAISDRRPGPTTLTINSGASPDIQVQVLRFWRR